MSAAVLIMCGCAILKPTTARFDDFKRLVDYPGKRQVVCPAQDARTAVIMVAGQSNAANFSAVDFRPKHKKKIINFFQGRCYIAQSPFLGAGGTGGEPWSALGERLIAQGQYDRVIFAPAAIEGSDIALWTPSGRLWPVLEDAIAHTKQHYRMTHILWRQGETDLAIGTREADYRARLNSLISAIRAKGVDAPFYVSVSTFCVSEPPLWSFDNPIARAQRAAVDDAPGARLGVDADRLLQGDDRIDKCHMSESGVRKMAQAWSELFARDAR